MINMTMTIEIPCLHGNLYTHIWSQHATIFARYIFCFFYYVLHCTNARVFC